MQAALQRSFGGPDVLRTESVADPVGRPGWVTVRLQAAALNWHDVLVRRGQYSSPLPHVPGADGAGVRADTGEEVMILPSLFWGARESAPSDEFEILGDHRFGTYAELISVPAEVLVPKPAGLSWEQAAALPLVGVTTFRALFSRGRLAAGESLLVIGASGGVATMAVVLGHAAGARVVVSSSSTDKLDAARSIGADDGVLHTDPEWVAQARSLTQGGRGFDVVLDSVGRWAESVSTLRTGGRLVVLGASAADTATLAMRPFFFGQFDLLGTTMGSPRDLAGLLRFLQDHDVPPPIIDRTFGLEDAAEAHRHLESGNAFGKIVLLTR